MSLDVCDEPILLPPDFWVTVGIITAVVGATAGSASIGCNVGIADGICVAVGIDAAVRASWALPSQSPATRIAMGWAYLVATGDQNHSNDDQ